MTTGDAGYGGPGPGPGPLADAPAQPAPVDTPPEESAGLVSDRRALTRRAALSTNASLSFAVDDDDAERRFRRWRTEDPFPAIDPALLNGGDLLDYIRATGMIFPHGQARDVKPASFLMHVEGPFAYATAGGERKFGELRTADDPSFDSARHQTSLELPGDTIVFVTVRPYIRMPDYMAMRFNLKIDHVYKGLLLGTGPLVDPGFTGRLSIPLHNLTSKKYVLHAGDGLIWAEFTKLSKHRLFSAATQRSSEQTAEFPPLKHLSERGIHDYIQEATGDGEIPATSVPAQLAEIREDFDDFKTAADVRATATDERTASAARDIGVLRAIVRGLSAAAIVGAVVGVFSIVIPTIDLAQQANKDNRAYDLQIQRQQQQITDLEAQVAQLMTALPKKTGHP